ncbi:AraC family transcriptional regulator [Bacillus horti]|uniref:DNA gyrase inhibitor GyrI n=1 Tax=Caldalkalibacillus horti TaxID=77523 RepID=A0ABT9VZM8_9BACI|nr:GyrI-like domain-containing protein [Bacillus horti]MDQ0166450.1 DNA gyrase inhibitor GyrI [Bacillus horti]
MDIKLETMLKHRLAYVRKVGPYGTTNYEAMVQLKKWAEERGLLTDRAVLYGIPQDNPEITPPKQCRYDACIAIAEDYPLDESILESELAGGSYAVCTVMHTAEDIQRAWAKLLPTIERLGYKIDNTPIIERYTGELLIKNLCEICVPIKPI